MMSLIPMTEYFILIYIVKEIHTYIGLKYTYKSPKIMESLTKQQQTASLEATSSAKELVA